MICMEYASQGCSSEPWCLVLLSGLHCVGMIGFPQGWPFYTPSWGHARLTQSTCPSYIVGVAQMPHPKSHCPRPPGKRRHSHQTGYSKSLEITPRCWGQRTDCSLVKIKFFSAPSSVFFADLFSPLCEELMFLCFGLYSLGNVTQAGSVGNLHRISLLKRSKSKEPFSYFSVMRRKPVCSRRESESEREAKRRIWK